MICLSASFMARHTLRNMHQAQDIDTKHPLSNFHVQIYGFGEIENQRC